MNGIYVIQVADNLFWGHGYYKNNVVDITVAKFYKSKEAAEKSKKKVNELFNLNCVVRKVKFEIYE